MSAARVRGERTANGGSAVRGRRCWSRLRPLWFCMLPLCLLIFRVQPLAAGRVLRYGGILRVEIPLLPATLEPVQMAGDAGAVVAACVYEGLTSWGGRAALAGLAERWMHSEDRKQWVFHLSAGLVFHDGTPCDALAVSESLHRLANPRESVHAWILEDLQGWGDFVAGRTSRIEGIYVVSSREIELVFARPAPDLAERLALPEAAIARRHGAVPVGTGPFRVADASAAAIHLVAFDAYRAGPPLLDGVDFVAAPDSGVAASEGGARLQRGDPRGHAPAGRKRLRMPARRLALALIHPESAALASADVRQRLAASLDSESWVRSVLAGDGEAAAGLVPGRSGAAARQTAAPAAPWPAQRVRIIGVAGEPVLRHLGQRLAERLVALGAEATHDVLPARQFASALQAASYDVVLLGWTPPQPEEDLPEATRARIVLSEVLQPVLGERLPPRWRAIVERRDAPTEAAVLESAHLLPLLFFHDAWDVSEMLTDMRPSALAADVGLSSAHLEPPRP